MEPTTQPEKESWISELGPSTKPPQGEHPVQSMRLALLLQSLLETQSWMVVHCLQTLPCFMLCIYLPLFSSPSLSTVPWGIIRL